MPLSSRRGFVVHWPGGTAGADPAQNIRNIEAFHVRPRPAGQGWAVVGYNAFVDRAGGLWWGAGRDVRGIHEATRNIDSFGVCCLISIGERPGPAMLAACRALYDQLCRDTGRTLTMSWHSRYLVTACPGPDLTAWVRAGMPVGAPPLPPGGDSVSPLSRDDQLWISRNALEQNAAMMRSPEFQGIIRRLVEEGIYNQRFNFREWVGQALRAFHNE